MSTRASSVQRFRSLMLLMGCALVMPLFAQRPSPAPAQTKSVLVKAAVVHVGDGRTFDDGAVGFRAGVIDYVGFSYGTQAAYDTIIELKGGHIYPGFILPDNTLGLHEIDLVRATDDEDEIGEMEPEVRALTAYNTDSRIVPTVRSNGVLIAQATPRGAVIAGTSSIVQLDAWGVNDAVVKADDGVHITWPDAVQRRREGGGPGGSEKDADDERGKKVEAIRQFFRRAKAYAQVPTAREFDQRLEAMRGVFDGHRTLFVHADRAREIQEALLLAREFDVKRVVIVGGYDAWRVADLLRDNKVDVILRRTHSLPLREDDDVDQPYRLPALLHAQGIRFCLGYTGEMERMGSRNLGFTAGTASAYGLTREEALQAITLDAARVLGIDRAYGSLEVGKSATLFLSTGDALDMRTCNVTNAFIDGRRLVLDDHQKQLWRQYEQRYGQKR